MKKYLLLVLMISGLLVGAQNKPADLICKAYFKYAVNNKQMWAIPSTGIDFYDKSDVEATSWWWDFGDGTTSTEQNPFHVFVHPVGGPTVKMSPYRTVTLTIVSVQGCKSQYSEMINIVDGTSYSDPNVSDPKECYINFGYNVNYNVQTLLPALTLDFYAKDVPYVTDWLWDFGDGSTSTEKNPTHSFNLPLKADSVLGDPNPFRTVCLTVKTSADCTVQECKTIDLYMNTDPVVPVKECVARYKYRMLAIDSIAKKVTVEFNNYSEGNDAKYVWTFNNGQTSNDFETKMNFAFEELPFKASLTIFGANGCSDTMWDEVTFERFGIYPPVEPYPTVMARFKAYRPSDIISIPEVIPYQFIDASSGNVISWLWQFEDGSYSLEAAPLVNFDFMKPTQNVCLTVYTSDSLKDTYCETIYLRDNYIDSSYIPKPEALYKMRVSGSFPMQMSSCAGTAKAQVYLKDSPVDASYYTWSNGTEGQEISGLCPTETYTVKAIAPDGNSVSLTFIFNSDGSIQEVPTYWNNWYLTGGLDNQLIKYIPMVQDMIVEWHLCDGSIVVSDSIPLELINCGGDKANMVMKDAAGNTVSTETISLKTLATKLKPEAPKTISVKLYPNPVTDVLNIKYSGKAIQNMQIDILDISGKRVSTQQLFDVEPGQNISLNVSYLQKGIFICKMSAGTQTLGMEKFIK